MSDGSYRFAAYGHVDAIGPDWLWDGCPRAPIYHADPWMLARADWIIGEYELASAGLAEWRIGERAEYEALAFLALTTSRAAREKAAKPPTTPSNSKPPTASSARRDAKIESLKRGSRYGR